MRPEGAGGTSINMDDSEEESDSKDQRHRDNILYHKGVLDKRTTIKHDGPFYLDGGESPHDAGDTDSEHLSFDGDDKSLHRESAVSTILRLADLEIWDGQIATYDTERLHSWRACCIINGTACEDSGIWRQTTTIFVVYAMTIIILSVCIAVIGKGAEGIPFYRKKEGQKHEEVYQIKEISEYVKVFVAFFLGLYLSLNVGRWWQLRTNGINPIFDATTHACTLLSAFKEFKVAKRVARYGRLSLQLVFNWHSGKHITFGDVRATFKKLVERGLLTKPEMTILLTDAKKGMVATDGVIDDNARVDMFRHAEIVWVWITCIMVRLHSQKRVSCALHYLLGITRQAQQACNSVRHQLTTQLPMPYVHIITFLVKAHNIVLAVTGALMTVFFAAQNVWILATFTECFRVMLISWLYNSVLTICSMMADPFGTDRIDFPRRKIDQELKRSTESVMYMGQNIPFLGEKSSASAKELAFDTRHSANVSVISHLRTSPSMSSIPTPHEDKMPVTKTSSDKKLE